MRLLIPTIKTHLRLEAAWSFPLYRESRNDSLRTKLGISTVGWKWSETEKSDPVTLPKGTVLIVDRVYLRQNAETYDSITFRVFSCPDKKLNKARFWAKLHDVNQIECTLDPATTPGLKGKSLFTEEEKPPRFGMKKHYKKGDLVVVRGHVKSGVGLVFEVENEGRYYGPRYWVALPSYTGKVDLLPYYGEKLPPACFGAYARYKDLRPPTTTEVEDQKTKLAKHRKRRVTAAEKLLAAYREARGTPLSGEDEEIVRDRGTRGWVRPTGYYSHPWQRFNDFRSKAKEDPVKTIQIDLAIARNPIRGYESYHDTIPAETKLVGYVQMGYLDYDEVAQAVKGRLKASELLERTSVLWADGVPVTP